MEDKKQGWKNVSPGGVSEGGSGSKFTTGNWRTQRPVIDFSKCKQCFNCWGFCPDNAVLVKDNKVLGFNYLHCKGCGVCAKECPNKAIKMIEENK